MGGPGSINKKKKETKRGISGIRRGGESGHWEGGKEEPPKIRVSRDPWFEKKTN